MSPWPPLEQRFWAKVRKTDHCWEWMGSKDTTGYGRIHANGRQRPAHRVSYEMHVGPIPDGLEIDHLCNNRGCVNPEHLDVVTRRQNILRSSHAGKMFCPSGHLMDERNTAYWGKKRVGRFCRECDRQKRRKSA